MKKFILNFLAFLLGCFVLLCIFLILEIISRYYYDRNFKIIYEHNPPLTIRSDTDKTRKLNAGIKGRGVIKQGSFPPITYTYSIDKKGRRITYPVSETEKKVNCLFFCCSFTYRIGVNDDETLPSQFAIRNPYCAAYNYGLPGGAPQDIYLATLEPDFADDIKNLPTIVIYTFIENHLRRLVGSWSIIGKWGKKLPCIELNNGRLEYLGDFGQAKPLSCFIFGLLYKSNFASILLQSMKIDYPTSFGEKDFELLHLLLTKTRENLSKKFPQVQMIFLFFPFSADAVPNLYEFFNKKKEYIVIDYLHDNNKREILLELLKENKFSFPDTHPTPITYSYVAEWLTETLKNRDLIP